MSTFSNRLRDLRQEKRMTQDDLAKALGISKSAVSMYENGKREPDFETLEAIADYFNVDMNYLLGNQANKSKSATQDQGWYLDPEVAEKAQEIYEDPETRILLDAKRDLSMEDLEAVLNIVKALKAKEGK